MIRRTVTAVALAGALMALAGCDSHTTAEHCDVAAAERTDEGALASSERTSLGDFCEFEHGTAVVQLDDHAVDWL